MVAPGLDREVGLAGPLFMVGLPGPRVDGAVRGCCGNCGWGA
jgi:hypothetical protein